MLVPARHEMSSFESKNIMNRVYWTETFENLKFLFGVLNNNDPESFAKIDFPKVKDSEPIDRKMLEEKLCIYLQ